MPRISDMRRAATTLLWRAYIIEIFFKSRFCNAEKQVNVGFYIFPEFRKFTGSRRPEICDKLAIIFSQSQSHILLFSILLFCLN